MSHQGDDTTHMIRRKHYFGRNWSSGILLLVFRMKYVLRQGSFWHL
jgi:hypothetical protein